MIPTQAEDSAATARPRIAIVVLTYRQVESTARALESLRACVGEPFRVLVWDNGSRDGTVAKLRAEYPEIQVVGCEENLGVAGGRNAAGRRAIELWDPEYLLFLDNDMTVDPRFVTELVRPLDENAEIGQTQAKLLQMDDPTRIDDGGGVKIVWWRGETIPVGFGEVDRGQYDEEKSCMACCGGAMMVRASIFMAIDGFDESFNPYGPEDLDFSLRVLAAGHRNLYVPTAVAYHAGTHTFGAGYSEAYARKKVKNWFRLLRRHAGPGQRLGFYLLGGPLSVLTMSWREARRGNFAAAAAAVREALGILRPD